MRPVSKKTAGILGCVFLFLACALSMVSLFWGILWMLIVSAICLGNSLDAHCLRDLSGDRSVVSEKIHVLNSGSIRQNLEIA